MPLTPAEILEVAELARLELTAPELAALGDELGAILAYVAELAALDTTGVEPTTHAVPLDCPLRDDTVEAPLDPAVALAGAPAVADGCFAVPAILDSGAPAR
jgi:aspartyl-tRNA(Asn)/glutamyl-tRNA(Gln) amidotransferase subunit C